MAWGARLIGLGSVLDLIDEIQVRLDDDVVYVTGTSVEYSIWVEFGTSKMAAQPYLRPAARSVERDLTQIAQGKDSLRSIVRAAALEIERRAKQRVPVDTGNLKGSIKAERVR